MNIKDIENEITEKNGIIFLEATWMMKVKSNMKKGKK